MRTFGEFLRQLLFLEFLDGWRDDDVARPAMALRVRESPKNRSVNEGDRK
jgi:hypothetical protein